MAGRRSNSAPLADTARKSDAEKRDARARRRSRHAEIVGRLLANEDFREWMFGTLFSLCAFENEMRETTPFEQGIRAAGSLIRRELLDADGAPEFFADLDRRYYAGIRRGIADALSSEAKGAGDVL